MLTHISCYVSLMTTLWLECDERKYQLQPTHRCSRCGALKTATPYSAAMWHNKSEAGRVLRCLDCSMPACLFMPNCKTYKQCRNPKCKQPNCTGPVQYLSAAELPSSVDQVMNFAYQACRYVRCVVKQPYGTCCGHPRRANARESHQ